MKKEDKSVDFYEENGTLVMTKEHHIRRGYCCESGCRHCPYGFLRVADEQNNTTTTKE